MWYQNYSDRDMRQHQDEGSAQAPSLLEQAQAAYQEMVLQATVPGLRPEDLRVFPAVVRYDYTN